MDKSNSFSFKALDPQFVMETMEDFLIATSVVELGPLMLIGGMNLKQYLKTKNQTMYRPTVDIDFDITSTEDWLRFLNKIPGEISDSSPKGYTYKVIKTREPIVTSGDTATIVCSNGVNFRIDMNIVTELNRWQNYTGYYPKGATVGRMLADKTKVFLSKKIYRRSKDLHDIYILSHSDDFRLEEISEDVLDRWESTGYPETPVHFADLDSLKHAYDKLRGIKNKSEFEEVFVRVLTFVSTLYLRLKDGNFKGYVWRANIGEWER